MATPAKPPKAGARAATDEGMLQRLKDQRKVQRKIAAVHANRRLLDEIAFYPAHDKRVETAEYKQVHKHLTIELDLPCLVCGVKHSTLQDKAQNRYGAKQMETHHHVIEWSLANAVDVDKFNATLLPHLKVRHPQNAAYSQPFTAQDVAAWVDHSADNLWVLCDVHHRAKYFGIHEISYPIWCPMDLLRADFDDYVREQIAMVKAQKTAKANKAAKKKA